MRNFLILLVVVMVVSLVAQQPAPQPTPPAAQQPTQQAAQATNLDDGKPAVFSTRSNLVIVDVTVKDKAGKVIENLRPQDFTVLEDGKPQKVSVFEFQKLATNPEPPPALTLADQLELPKAAKTTITAERPGEVQYHDKCLLVFFLDFSSMGIPEQLRAQEAALEYISKKITPADLVSILLYTSTIQVKTDFTDDRDVL